jgi:hypothetical protein
MVTRLTDALYRDVRAILDQARSSAYRAVNLAMVTAYWQVGRLIVEHEQQGRRRAQYGEAVVASLAGRLSADLGRGFDERNLWYMRSFYLAFPILNAPRSELPGAATRAAGRLASPAEAGLPALRPELSWTHYRLLLGASSTTCRHSSLNWAKGFRLSRGRSACVSTMRISSWIWSSTTTCSDASS